MRIIIIIIFCYFSPWTLLKTNLVLALVMFLLSIGALHKLVQILGKLFATFFTRSTPVVVTCFCLLSICGG